MFSLLNNLDFVYFKKFKYCSYAPKVPKCAPGTDGVSSLSDLLAEKLVRVTLWIVSTFILFTNSMVLWRRIFASTNQMSPLSLVITNLAAADLLMGIYLLVIGSQDIRLRGVYKDFAHSWTSSWLCTATGMIAMVSSEASVLILLLISAERFLLIASPLKHHSSLSLKAALGSVLSIWLFTVVVAIIPVVHWRHTVRFYGSNGLCFPLHIDEPYFAGWQYSAFVFIGLNLAGLIGIGVMYTAVFLSIWKTRKATTITVPDSDFALRFFFIFLTNASCWIPIIVLKIMAFLHIKFTGELYGWLAVFVIPVNSAVNPILYTFTAPNYRSMLQHFRLNCKKMMNQGIFFLNVSVE
ncbi:hypothetical protein AAG570_011493 [Ranatra chinensis]|uniref:G-protein coupled receptors family 1 profile domain-containing protein n=1 Tax=Ranatra chinensis TaxID=642074 RepID=A0ABD0YKY1_9HEMI